MTSWLWHVNHCICLPASCSQWQLTWSVNTKCPQQILGIIWCDYVRNTEVSSCTGLPPVSNQIARGRNAIYGRVTRLPDTTLAHQALLRQMEKSSWQSVDLRTQHGNVSPVVRMPTGPISFTTTTITFPSQPSGGKPSVAVTREWRYGQRRPCIKDDDEWQLSRGHKVDSSQKNCCDEFSVSRRFLRAKTYAPRTEKVGERIVPVLISSSSSGDGYKA